MKKLKKSDVINALWELHRKGDPEVAAYDINYFDYTGWLKKSLAVKLGLQLPGEELKKEDGDEEEAPPSKIKETTHYDKKGNPQVSVREWHFKSDHLLGKSDILDILLQMVKNGEESNRINRHTVSKYEATGELDQDIEKMVYKKAGKDWFELRKELDAHMKKSGPSLLAASKDPKKKKPSKKEEEKAIASLLGDMDRYAGREGPNPKAVEREKFLNKEKGDSDFYDDKKKHDHQLRGAKKPLLRIKKKSLIKLDREDIDYQERMDAHVKEEYDEFTGRGGRDEVDYLRHKRALESKGKKKEVKKEDEKAAKPRKAKFSNRAAPSKIGIKVKQHGSKYHGGGDPGISDGGDE